jgi:hypothetical protein
MNENDKYRDFLWALVISGLIVFIIFVKLAEKTAEPTKKVTTTTVMSPEEKAKRKAVSVGSLKQIYYMGYDSQIITEKGTWAVNGRASGIFGSPVKIKPYYRHICINSDCYPISN